MKRSSSTLAKTESARPSRGAAVADTRAAPRGALDGTGWSAASQGVQAEPPAAAPAAGLLAEDEAAVSRGQMRKSEFLDTLRTALCAAVDDALAGTGRNSQGCPWIDHWLAHYRGQTAGHIEAALQRYAPETRGARDAASYVRLVAERAARGARSWATTGDVPDLPQDASASPMAGGDALNAFGGMFFKAKPGGPAQGADAGAVRDRLGAGRPLPTSLRDRMEPAFAASFSEVRVHTDTTGNQLSDQLNARAFTVGQHVAFGPGEFRPGTLEGDALIAHELAHVVQQKDGQAATSKGTDASALERDADRAAESAAMSSLGRTPAQRGTRMRSGLRLQRCAKDSTQKAPSKLLDDFAAKFSAAADLIRKSPEGMKLVLEAQVAGVEFGGFSEDGPAASPWAYTTANKVYVPRMRSDAMVAMSDFLFELNNAIRAPRFAQIHNEATKGSAGTLTARSYARQKVEQEVEGMLRLGGIWFEMKKSAPGTAWDKYDGDFFLAQFNAFNAGTKTKEDIINDVLQWKNGIETTKTNEQYYMDQYTGLAGGR